MEGELTVLRTVRALRVVAIDPGLGHLLERLEGIGGAPWPALRDALEAREEADQPEAA